MELRDYQQASEFEINLAWLAVQNVLMVAPTGSGKTVVMAEVIKKHNGVSCAIAHRNELVSQISLTLARNGIYHKLIGNNDLIREIVKLHVSETGVNYYSPSSNCAVASVGTLLARQKKLTSWLPKVTLWVTDEAHHVLDDNQWGKACKLFPNAKGLGVTATPLRADGCGLGRHTDGLFDTMIESSTMRQLINRGYLTDYRIFAPPNDLDMDGVTVTGSGEFSAKETKKRIEKSRIIGNVVDHYLKIAPGKLGITFAIDVETAHKICDQYIAKGVPAKVITAKTSITERAKILREFKNKEILQLVNVDLFGEGFDLPALEVVSFARPTQSYGLYVQQFGRVLRILAGKKYGIIIDHVGNVDRHGLPDKIRIWTLDRQEKRSRNKHDPDMIPLKTCNVCTAKYEAFYKICPNCGYENVPLTRGSPKEVDGELKELDPAILKIMRGEIDKIENDPKMPWGVSGNIQVGIINKHAKQQDSLKCMQESIRWFIGYYQSLGNDVDTSQKYFYWRFNIDVMSAQGLKKKDSEILRSKIDNFLFEKEVMI